MGDGMPDLNFNFSRHNQSCDYFERGYDLILNKTKIMRRNFLHQNFMKCFDSI